MPNVSRRHVLQTITAGIIAVAGCAGSTETARIQEPNDRRTLKNIETQQVRNTDGAVLFTNRGELPTRDAESDRFVQRSRSVIVSAETIERLTFASVPEARRLRSFVAATDFSEASMYLLTMPVTACHTIRLKGVYIETDELQDGDLHPHADFCRTYRPADVECDTETHHTVGFAIRLPVAAEESSGTGRGMSNSCEHSRPPWDSFNPADSTPNGSDSP